MKTVTFFILLFFLAIPPGTKSTVWQASMDVFTGVYDGLTEDMEFQFTASNGQVYLFDEIEENLEYDLYDEQNFGRTFKVTWQKKTIEILDDEDEPTGEMEEIQVIVALQRL